MSDDEPREIPFTGNHLNKLREKAVPLAELCAWEYPDDANMRIQELEAVRKEQAIGWNKANERIQELEAENAKLKLARWDSNSSKSNAYREEYVKTLEAIVEPLKTEVESWKHSYAELEASQMHPVRMRELKDLRKERDELKKDLEHAAGVIHSFGYGKAQAKLDRYEAALMKIADVTSAIDYPIRNVSFADWELRRMARETLEWSKTAL